MEGGMSIDNPTSLLDLALGAEERANARVCELEDLRDVLVKQIRYLLQCIESGKRPTLVRVNSALKKAASKSAKLNHGLDGIPQRGLLT
jgi:hypothetical protein